MGDMAIFRSTEGTITGATDSSSAVVPYNIDALLRQIYVEIGDSAEETTTYLLNAFIEVVSKYRTNNFWFNEHTVEFIYPIEPEKSVIVLSQAGAIHRIFLKVTPAYDMDNPNKNPTVTTLREVSLEHMQLIVAENRRLYGTPQYWSREGETILIHPARPLNNHENSIYELIIVYSGDNAFGQVDGGTGAVTQIDTYTPNRWVRYAFTLVKEGVKGLYYKNIAHDFDNAQASFLAEREAKELLDTETSRRANIRYVGGVRPRYYARSCNPWKVVEW